MGTSCSLRWREADDGSGSGSSTPPTPSPPASARTFEIAETEMYGEFFDIPEPDELVFVSWFEGGEVFRSGCTFRRGKGKIFYFRPGHETYPIYFLPQVRKVLANAVAWAAPNRGPAYPYASGAINEREPLNPIPQKHPDTRTSWLISDDCHIRVPVCQTR